MEAQDQVGSRARLLHKLGHLLGGSRPTVLTSPCRIPSLAAEVTTVSPSENATDHQVAIGDSEFKFLHKLGHLLYVPSDEMVVPMERTSTTTVLDQASTTDKDNLLSAQSPKIMTSITKDEAYDFETSCMSVQPPPSPIANVLTDGRLRLIRKLDQLLNLTPATVPVRRARPCKRLVNDVVSKISQRSTIKSPQGGRRNSGDPPAFYALATNKFDVGENRPLVSSCTIETSASFRLMDSVKSISDKRGNLIKIPNYKTRNVLSNRKFGAPTTTTLSSSTTGSIVDRNQLRKLTSQSAKHVQFDDYGNVSYSGTLASSGQLSQGKSQQKPALILAAQTRSTTMDHMYTPECRRQLLTAELCSGDAVQRAEALNLRLTELLDSQSQELAKQGERITNIVLDRSRQDKTILKLSAEIKYYKSCFVAAAKYNGGSDQGVEGVAAAELSIPEELIRCQEIIKGLESERNKNCTLISSLASELSESKNNLTKARLQLTQSQSEASEKERTTRKLLKRYRDKIKMQQVRLKKKNQTMRKLSQQIKSSKVDAACVSEKHAHHLDNVIPSEINLVGDGVSENILPDIYYVLVDSDQLEVVNAESSDSEQAVEIYLQQVDQHDTVVQGMDGAPTCNNNNADVRRSLRKRTEVKKFAD